jgi:acyl-CoA thioester hydrolase
MDGSPAIWRTRVRVYECDALGHVNNAVYLHYLQQATAEAWASLRASTWGLRSLSMEYLAPAYDGDELEVRAWASGLETARLVCGYSIRRVVDEKTLLQARASWAEPEGEASRHIAPDWPIAPAEWPSPSSLRLWPDRLNAHRYRWNHTVCSYEVDGSSAANPANLLRWVEEAKMVACAQVGWPLERMFGADLMIVQIRHDSEFYAPLRVGDRVEVVSRIRDLRLLKGTWCHEIYRLGLAPTGATADKELVALDYSAGAFLTCAGRPNPAPKAMLEALSSGDSDVATV